MYQEHVLEETLEAYAMGRLPEAELDRVDEHLLTCERCRMLLSETDERIRLMKMAAQRIRTEEISFRRKEKPWWERLSGPVSRRPAWAVGTIAVLAAVLVLPGLRTQDETAPYRDVALSAMRGQETTVAADSGAGNRRLRLQLDLGGVDAPAPYRVTVVDGVGETLWEGDLDAPTPVAGVSATPSGEIKLDRTLAAGQYWVRLYAKAEGSPLLREYPLLVK